MFGGQVVKTHPAPEKIEMARGRSLLQLSVKGLKAATDSVKDSTPNILAIAGLIEKFSAGRLAEPQRRVAGSMRGWSSARVPACSRLSKTGPSGV